MIELREATRSTLTNWGKGGQAYAHPEDHHGHKNRWDNKVGKLQTTVAEYNDLDMDTFWKQDILKFTLKVQGETDTYSVTIQFDKILDKLSGRVKANYNKLEIRLIYDSLFQAISQGDVKVDCTCADWKYRGKYWATKDGYNANEPETRPSNITNPGNVFKGGCKHILQVLNNVEWLQKLASVINNYIYYCKDHFEYNYSRYIFPKVYGVNYDRAVQMTINDFDENGNVADNLATDKSTINLANALGKVRGRFKPGSNKNPATQKSAIDSK